MIETLEKVDASVRKTLAYANDNAEHGFDDWKLPERSASDGLGDREDFMLLAASRLIHEGVDPAKMYFVLCHTVGGKGFNHAFLAVETSEGLHTCADTFRPRVQPILEAYDDDELRRWRRVSEPANWRHWG